MQSRTATMRAPFVVAKLMLFAQKPECCGMFDLTRGTQVLLETCNRCVCLCLAGSVGSDE